MTVMDFLNALGKVDAKYIEECITYEKKSEKKPFVYNKWIKYGSMVAACFVLVVATVFVINYSRTEVPPVTVVEENGFRIENGVLVGYTGSETDITIPEMVKEIADFSFLSNESAKQIEIVRLNSSVQKIENNAFAGLEQLKEIVVPEDSTGFISEGGLVMTSDETLLLHYERSTEEAFALPEKVMAVGAHAVQKTELVDIDFGDKLEYIGYGAFLDNYNLKEIDLPETVTYIGERAFSGCVSAVKGNLPENIEIGEGAFTDVPFTYAASIEMGKMVPSEMIERGLITPSQAVMISNQTRFHEQIESVFRSIKQGSTSWNSHTQDHPTLPEDLVIPKWVVSRDLTYADRGWGGIDDSDLQVFIVSGNYTIVIESSVESFVSGKTLWSDTAFVVDKVYYINNNAEESDEKFSNGWTVKFDMKDGNYLNVTMIHQDGRVVRGAKVLNSTTKPVLSFSPDGNRVAIEYTNDGKTELYVQSLNGDDLVNDMYGYNLYCKVHLGAYKAGTVQWSDNEKITGYNEHGIFMFDIYDEKCLTHWNGIKEDKIALAKELLNMTFAEIEAKYGEVRYTGVVDDGGSPILRAKNLSEFELKIKRLPFWDDPNFHEILSKGDWLDKSWKPDIVILFAQNSSIGLLSGGDDISIGKNFILEHEPYAYWGYSGTHVEIKYEGCYVTYSMSETVVDKTKYDDDEQRMKAYLGNPKGTISYAIDISLKSYDELNPKPKPSVLNEEIKNGSITPLEAIKKSDQKALYKQIEFILKHFYVEGDDAYNLEITDGIPVSVEGALARKPTVPDDLVVPDKFDLSELTYVDLGWNINQAGGRIMQIILDAGDYNIIMQMGFPTLNSTMSEWRDVEFCILDVFYLRKDLKDPDVKSHGWSVFFDKHDGLYRGMTFVHDNGKILRVSADRSQTPYELTFSPDGTRVIIEYTNIRHALDFAVVALNGDLLSGHWSYDNFGGIHVKGSLVWDGNNTIIGENRTGKFKWFIYESKVSFLSYNRDVTFDSAQELLGMTFGEIEAKYGELKYLGLEVGGSPVFSIKRLPAFKLKINELPFDANTISGKSLNEWLDKGQKPDVVILNDLNATIGGLGYYYDISAGKEFIHMHEPVAYSELNSAFVEINYNGYYVTYRAGIVDVGSTDDEYLQIMKSYLNDPNGIVSRIEVSTKKNENIKGVTLG